MFFQDLLVTVASHKLESSRYNMPHLLHFLVYSHRPNAVRISTRAKTFHSQLIEQLQLLDSPTCKTKLAMTYFGQWWMLTDGEWLASPRLSLDTMVQALRDYYDSEPFFVASTIKILMLHPTWEHTFCFSHHTARWLYCPHCQNARQRADDAEYAELGISTLRCATVLFSLQLALNRRDAVLTPEQRRAALPLSAEDVANILLTNAALPRARHIFNHPALNMQGIGQFPVGGPEQESRLPHDALFERQMVEVNALAVDMPQGDSAYVAEGSRAAISAPRHPDSTTIIPRPTLVGGFAATDLPQPLACDLGDPEDSAGQAEHIATLESRVCQLAIRPLPSRAHAADASHVSGPSRSVESLCFAHVC